MTKPKAQIRRFDVFAEYSRQEALKDGLPADEAKGYGLWLAKVVAARRFRGGKPPPERPAAEGEEKEARPERRRRGKWRLLGDEAQTDKRFDREIVERMGRTFYERVFRPAIRRAFQEGQSYVTIRDTIRRDWSE
jgi:hypothetical protein